MIRMPGLKNAARLWPAVPVRFSSSKSSGKPGLAMLVGDLAADFRADGAVHIADLVAQRQLVTQIDGLVGVLQDDVIQRPIHETIVAFAGMKTRRGGIVLADVGQEPAQIERVGLSDGRAPAVGAASRRGR